MKNYVVAVIGSMSAGKSSLLNAMAGMELLPCQNEACTATVFRVEDHDELHRFRARRKFKDGEWSEWTDKGVDRELLAEWNREAPEEIVVQGNLPEIDNTPDGVRVCFIDTPGPNNARCEEHAQITRRLLAEHYFASLIFVLNASVTGVVDEFTLLCQVKKLLDEQESPPEVIFVLNKIDVIDPEREDLCGMVSNVRKYLMENVGFHDPLVLPVSSALSLAIRLAMSSAKRLTQRQLARLKKKYADNGGKQRRLCYSRHYVCRLPELQQVALANLMDQFERNDDLMKTAFASTSALQEAVAALRHRGRKTPSRKIWIHGVFTTFGRLQDADLRSGVPLLEKLLQRRLLAVQAGTVLLPDARQDTALDDAADVYTEGSQTLPFSEAAFLSASDSIQEKLPPAVCRAENSPAIPLTEKNNTVNSTQEGTPTMLNVELTYNPYQVATELYVDGNPVPRDSKLSQLTAGRRLQAWVDQLLPTLFDCYRETAMSIRFKGVEGDYEDLYSAVKEFERGPDKSAFRIKLENPEFSRRSVDGRIARLRELFASGKEGAFANLFKSQQMEDAFNRATDSKFEAIVIATMSSGKSTLVNALLGQELMPAKNEACTAITATIENDDSMAGRPFLAWRYGKDGKPLSDQDEATLKLLTEWNADEKTETIRLRGDIPAIHQTRDCTLFVTDTPGPNNARNAAHMKTMVKAIRSKPLSMVLYILNATQLSTTDDNNLLRMVCEEMKRGGRQSHDRFVFIANKIDAFDPDKDESVTGALRHVREYLGRNGITNPIVIPASARLAKLLRQPQESLSKRDRSDLQTYVELFTEESEMNMLEHSRSSISRGCYQRLSKKLEEAQKEAQKEKERSREKVAELLSGIPIVEELLNEFLRKYAIPAKLRDGVDSFRQIVRDSEVAEQMSRMLEKSEAEVKACIGAIQALKNDQSHLNTANEFRQKVAGMEYRPSPETVRICMEVKARIGKMIDELHEKYGSADLPLEQARTVLENVKKACRLLEADVLVILQDALKTETLGILDKLRKEYQQYVENALGQSFPVESGARSLAFATMELPSDAEIAENCAFTAREKRDTGKTETVKVGQEWTQVGSHTEKHRLWWTLWLWSEEVTVPDYGWKDVLEEQKVYENVEVSYVKMKEALKLVETQVRIFGQERIDEFKKNAKEVVEGAKQALLDTMKRIDDKLQTVASQLEKTLYSQDAKTRQMEECRKKVEWCRQFQEKLDEVLAI